MLPKIKMDTKCTNAQQFAFKHWLLQQLNKNIRDTFKRQMEEKYGKNNVS